MSEISVGVCPVCNGTGLLPVLSHSAVDPSKPNAKYRNCNNCGEQYGMQSTGYVPLTDNGEPCTHSYFSRRVSTSETEYKCPKCKDRYFSTNGVNDG